jgi:hypothetical protein
MKRSTLLSAVIAAGALTGILASVATAAPPPAKKQDMQALKQCMTGCAQAYGNSNNPFYQQCVYRCIEMYGGGHN